ncbi:hemerythrin domain-containing protein [Fodinisporobacter ferrooxydans]|uniref:Hemerythrin domain-containing protein n=1 Tax=Fodinisporobacter ferrooxydans TaxID=2901836 RepID=A0ABY4CNQ8_9BACL|nr:hemerythrin domain-containing protein [Alicyclobacillaceae bacterium MYW30-H2]
MKTFAFQFSDSFIKPLLDNGYSKVVQFSFPKGKVLEKHKTSSDILVFVPQGNIRFQAVEEAVLKSGEMISLEKNIEHSITALEDSIVVLVLTPSPSAHSILKPQTAKPPTHERMSTEHVKKAVSPQLWSFVEEHAELLQILDKAAEGYEADTYALVDRMVEEELNKHFRYEEEYLFPALGKYIGTTAGPIAVMLAEHKIIRDNHQQLQKKLQQLQNGQGDETDVVQAYSALEGVLRPHIIKEDNVLFPMASGVMSEEDKDNVARLVNEEKGE